MSVSEIRADAEINLDEFERRLRAPGAQPASAEDPLAELARLIETYGLARGGSPSPAETVSTPGPEAVQSLETATPQPSIASAQDEPSGTASADLEAQVSEFEDSHLHDPNGADLAPERRSQGLTLKVSALALAGATAMIGGVFWHKGGAPRLPAAPPSIAAAQVPTKGPTKGPPPSGETGATSGDAGATPPNVTQPAQVKVVGSEEQPIAVDAHAPPGGTPPPAAAPAGAAQPTAGASAGQPVAAAVNPPVVAPPTADPSPGAPQFPDANPVPDAKPVHTASLPSDAEPNPMAAPSATDSGEAAHRDDAPKPPAKPAPKAASEAAAVQHPSTPKPDLPTKPKRSSTRVAVARADATALGAAPETRSQALHLGSSTTPQTPAEPQAAPPAPPEAAEQPANPLTHAFSFIVGALAPPATSAPQPVDQTAAKSGDWAVQFAAPKSEAQAKIEAARLNANYAPALNGATIGVHKTVVNGETSYALRVAGLSKDDAAALCARLKGRHCFLVK